MISLVPLPKFNTPEEYRIVTGNKTLGALPVDSLILKDQHIIFGGKRWKVTDIDDEKKVIYVVSTKGGRPPKFSGSGMSVHDEVRKEMFEIYNSGDYRIDLGDQKVDFADDKARQLFIEGAEFFKHSRLNNQSIVQSGQHCYLFSWMGDKTVNTLTVLLMKGGFVASSFAGVIEIQKATPVEVESYLLDMVKNKLPDETELAEVLSEQQKQVEKYDQFISEPLLSEGYGKKAFDSLAAKNWILSNIRG